MLVHRRTGRDSIARADGIVDRHMFVNGRGLALELVDALEDPVPDNVLERLQEIEEDVVVRPPRAIAT